jgi:hypothetical protein
MLFNNNECKSASCWCLVSSKWRFFGQLAYALQTVDNLVLAGGTLAGTCNCPMLSQHKTEVHQQLDKLLVFLQSAPCHTLYTYRDRYEVDARIICKRSFTVEEFISV